MTNKDRREFNTYLATCSNSQVYGVLAKEQQAGRRDYVALAQSELLRRGLSRA